jgi:Transposase IS66 family
MKIELPEIGPDERTPLVETLLGLLRQLMDRVAELERLHQELRDENARLKGQKERPDIKPSTLEKPEKPADAAGPGTGKGRRRGKPTGPRTQELVIHETTKVEPPDLPPGATFRQFESLVIQDLKLETWNTKYERARYDLPGGGSVLAPLPAGVLPVEGGHFGAKLVAFILSQYYQALVTQPVLLEQLWDYGITISAGQLHCILTENKDHFHKEKAELLGAGLTTATYIGVDDTGARHQGKNGFTTAIGNDLFAYFETTDSKSRLNFLHILQGDVRTYVINETTLVYWNQQGLPEALRNNLTTGPREFADEEAWKARLAELRITNERHVRIATGGTLLGGLTDRGVSPNLIVLSDGALQFVILLHAACWIHAERPLLKMVPHNDAHRAVIETIRGQLWELYKALKTYKLNPDPAQKPLLEARFDALVEQRTGYPNVDQVLKSMCERKADLLRVLEHPEIPLHNNAEESDIREFVKRRKISGGTRSVAGRRCRDTFASLKKTCRKLGICFWEYLTDRVAGLGRLPRLADVICQKAQEAVAKKPPAPSPPAASEAAATTAVAVPG